MSRLLQDHLTESAQRHPERTALVMRDRRVTYGELDELSSRMASMLTEVGCQRNDRVCLLSPKSPDAIAAMLGVLKAGCAYVPIDTDSPAGRVQHVLRAADPRVLLTSSSATGLLDGLADEGVLTASTTVGSLDEPFATERYKSQFARAEWVRQEPRDHVPRGGPSDIAHILFTSGSTGVPKGVMITHANVLAFVAWANNYFGMGPDERWSGHPPLHFDLSTYDIYGTLASGAELHLMPTELNLLPHKLAAHIRDSELTRWFSVPSILSYMVRFGAIEHGDFPTLRKLLWCGEVLPTPVLMTLMERLPHVTFTNLYGPTEATIASSFHTVEQRPTSETASTPIGTACAGEELLILDDGGREAAVGQVGDLYIAGVGLSPGYWRDPERTAAVFVADPREDVADRTIYRTGDLASWGDDGLVRFHGRADAQIKHRGYRIELGEIETAVNALDEVKECAVVALPTDGFEGTVICCAYAASSDAASVATLRTGLRRQLPTHMIPTRWLAVADLPRNANGKIDRKIVTRWIEEDDR
jgi:amino acid adenylation domain-containing protein